MKDPGFLTMPTATIHLSTGDTSATMPQKHHPQPQQQQQQQQARPALRRAVYIHVSDVITNAYNIDHAKLEEELSRVRKCPSTATGTAEAGSSSGGTTTTTPAGNSATAVGAALDRGLSSSDAMDSAAVPPGTTSGNKRLSPPRGGFNLCV